MGERDSRGATGEPTFLKTIGESSKLDKVSSVKTSSIMNDVYGLPKNSSFSVGLCSTVSGWL